MTALVFEKDALMQWNNNRITDHNRGNLEVSVERIETTKRMANGTLRKYIVADKRKFSTSWSNLPFSDEFTVDGFWGGREIESFYNTVPGAFTLKITEGDGTVASFNVMLSSFSKTLSKRGRYDMWDVSVEMEEV